MRRTLQSSLRNVACAALGASLLAPAAGLFAEEDLAPPKRVVASGAVVESPAKPAANTEPADKAKRKESDPARVVAAAPAMNGPNAYDYGDPWESTARFLLFTPGGPLIVDIDLTLNGEPYRMHRERQVQELLAAADNNLDGVSTWAEARENPRFARGFVRAFGNAAQQETYLRSIDANKNGIMERSEAQQLAGQRLGPGDSFSLNPANGISHPDLRTLLDEDGNGGLSALERVKAGERLKSRDANDNDLVDAMELVDGPAAGNPYSAGGGFVRRGGRGQDYLTWRIIGPINTASLRQNLIARYHPGGPLSPKDMPIIPQTAAALDANGDGNIEAAELEPLGKLPPHLKLMGNFGKQAKHPVGLHLLEVSAELGERAKMVEEHGNITRLNLAGVKIEFEGHKQAPQLANFKQNAVSVMERFDTDKNGYLEKKEATMLGSQFEQWDEDGDGKVFLAEIERTYEMLYAPQMMQITGATADRGNALFASVDINGDGRLSARELKHAAASLAKLDKDGDGYVSRDEIPGSMSVTLGQGQIYAYAQPVIVVDPNRVQRPGQPPAQADWFTRMDRNGDGDLTPREFLGTPEQFSKLDADADGFVTRDEAKEK